MRTIQGEGNRAVDGFFEGNEGFGALYAIDFLDFIVQHFPQVRSVAADNFAENTVNPGGIVNIDDLRNLLQLMRNIIVERAFVQINAEEGTDVPAKFGVINGEGRAFDDAELLQFFHTDMDGAAGNVNFFADFGIRHIGILHQEGQNFEVNVVNFQIFIHTGQAKFSYIQQN
jgi:hypothetical protein